MSWAVSAGAIADELRIPANTLSFHLKELVSAGLIASRREGRSVYSSLNKSNVRRLIAYLCEDCCGSRPELCGVDFPAAGARCC